MNAFDPATPSPVDRWASQLATQLRLLLADTADEPPAQRDEAIREAVQQRLETIPESEHNYYLDVLARYFPVLLEEGKDLAAMAEPAAAGHAPEQMEISDLVEALAARRQEMDETTREGVVARLVDAGIVVVDQAARDAAPVEAALPPDLVRRMRLRPQTRCDVDHALRLMGKLLENFFAQDGVTWSIWHKVAPKSRIHRESAEALHVLCGRYLSGDTKVAIEDLQRAFEKSCQINAALLGAIGLVGRSLAGKLSERISAQSIMSQAEMDGQRFMQSPEKRYWNKYLELARYLDRDMLEQTIDEILSHHAEEFASGGRRRQS